MSENRKPTPEYLSLSPSSIPMVNAFLDNAATHGYCSKLTRLELISPPQGLIHPSETHILTAMNRLWDDTGIIAPLISVAANQDDTADILYGLAKKEIHDLSDRGISMKDVRAAGEGGTCPRQVFEGMNTAWHNMVVGVKRVAFERGLTPNPNELAPVAAAYRAENVRLLQALSTRLTKPISELGHRELKFNADGRLIDVIEKLTVPIIPDPKALLAILPNELYTANGHIRMHGLEDELYFLRNCGQAGHDVARYLITLLKGQDAVEEIRITHPNR